jgi:Mg/Co/Ni transporter MgtE
MEEFFWNTTERRKELLKKYYQHECELKNQKHIHRTLIERKNKALYRYLNATEPYEKLESLDEANNNDREVMPIIEKISELEKILAGVNEDIEKYLKEYYRHADN